MHGLFTIARREFTGYFVTPLAYVFLVVFLISAAVAPFYFGRFMESRLADLLSFAEHQDRRDSELARAQIGHVEVDDLRAVGRRSIIHDPDV